MATPPGSPRRGGAAPGPAAHDSTPREHGTDPAPPLRKRCSTQGSYPEEDPATLPRRWGVPPHPPDRTANPTGTRLEPGPHPAETARPQPRPERSRPIAGASAPDAPAHRSGPAASGAHARPPRPERPVGPGAAGRRRSGEVHGPRGRRPPEARKNRREGPENRKGRKRV